jgi:hypothetical protein
MRINLLKVILVMAALLMYADVGAEPPTNTAAPKKEFKTLGEILRLIPSDLQPHKEPWKKNPLLNFNKWFKENIVGARLSLQNQQLLQITDSMHTISVNCDSSRVGTVQYRTARGVTVQFGKEWKNVTAALAKLKIGSPVTVTGTIQEISAQPCMSEKPPMVLIHVTLCDPQLGNK